MLDIYVRKRSHVYNGVLSSIFKKSIRTTYSSTIIVHMPLAFSSEQPHSNRFIGETGLTGLRAAAQAI